MDNEILKYYDGQVISIGDVVSYSRKGERVYSISQGTVKKLGKKKVILESGFQFYPLDLKLKCRKFKNT